MATGPVTTPRAEPVTVAASVPPDRLRGIVLMLGAVFLFSIMDAISKGIAVRTDTVMALWARYLGQALIVLTLVAPRLRTVLRTRYPALQFLRSLFLLSATTCFFFGISRIGLAEATAIMDVNPVLITVGAALFLGERLGPRRLMGVLTALVGALIIIRPGTAVFSPWSILPLAAAGFFTAYALATRFVGRDEDPWTSLVYAALVGAVVLSVVVPGRWVTPDPATAALMMVIGGFGAAGQLLLIRALSVSEAGLVAPFAYTGLIFATIWGAVFFDEWPDGPTYLGTAIIVAAGLHVWHRERRNGDA